MTELCGRSPTTPGYAPCSRTKHKSGPCAHGLLSFDQLRAQAIELRDKVDGLETTLRLVRSQRQAFLDQLTELQATLNAPELHDFAKGVALEASHQRIRWGSDHDAGKEPADWFWLVGYLAGKALASHMKGVEAGWASIDVDKALHHTITAAAALANWHSAIMGKTNMRPGIVPPEGT